MEQRTVDAIAAIQQTTVPVIVVVKAKLPKELSFQRNKAGPDGGCDLHCGDDCSCGCDE